MKVENINDITEIQPSTNLFINVYVCTTNCRCKYNQFKTIAKNTKIHLKLFKDANK